MIVTERDAARFWSKVDKSGDCWVWTAARNSLGYGWFRTSGRPHLAHRVAIVISGICPLPGMFVCHTCDNPCCVNPSHLFVGTPADNVADRQNKCRSWLPKGERNPKSKLSQDGLENIFKLKADGLSTREISSLTQISKAQVYKILNGLSWSHATEHLRTR